MTDVGAPQDRIQALLDEWQATESDTAREEAFTLLYAEWQRAIRRLMRAPDDRADAALQDAMWHACTPSEKTGRLPVHAPDGAGNPRAWRATVLRSRVISGYRRETTRSRKERLFNEGLSRDALKAARRRQVDQDQASHRLPEPIETARPPAERVPSPEDEAVVLDHLRHRRDQVLDYLPDLAVRRRVLIALVLGIDPTPWAEELAAESNEGDDALTDLLHRIEVALAPTNDPPAFTSRRLGGVEVTWPMVRVLDAESTNTETIRKTLDRAAADLARRVQAVSGGGDA